LVSVVASQSPPAAASAKVWLGHESAIEAHLRTAQVTKVTEIGTGVTRPQRAFLDPAAPVGSLVWKPLPPGRRAGHWESYKSEIAACQLDRLLDLRMVPPAVERRIGEETGAAIMWLDGPRSVKESGWKVPSGPLWNAAIRRMLMFDNLIGNPDRNAGNILIGAPGELILIDHSRAFITSTRVEKFERVDAALWERITAATDDDLRRVLQPWIEKYAVDATIERRQRMIAAVDGLVKKNGRAAVIIP
jgi:hypothetical protein